MFLKKYGRPTPKFWVCLGNYHGGSGAGIASVRMAQLQLIRSAHTFGARLGACMCGVHINVCKCMRPAAAACRRSQYCDIKRNMADETDIVDKSRHLQMLSHHSSEFNSVFELSPGTGFKVVKSTFVIVFDILYMYSFISCSNIHSPAWFVWWNESRSR